MCKYIYIYIYIVSGVQHIKDSVIYNVKVNVKFDSVISQNRLHFLERNDRAKDTYILLE